MKKQTLRGKSDKADNSMFSKNQKLHENVFAHQLEETKRRFEKKNWLHSYSLFCLSDFIIFCSLLYKECAISIAHLHSFVNKDFE